MSPSPQEVNSSDGSLDQYLREIARFPLIDRDEEARLAREIRAGCDEALEDLVRANLRFVVSVAKRYQNRGVPLADLINEGNLGLIRAARRFDETKGIKFISYAVWWIRQAILKAVADQGRIVRVPPSRVGEIRRIGRKLERPTPETSATSGPGEASPAPSTPTAVDLAAAIALSRYHVSLDAPIGEGETICLVDCIPDRLTPTPEGIAHARALRETVDGALATLGERESKVLRLYFGLDDHDPITLEEIGEILGITRERARQIKEHALRRLRHASRSRFLETFKQ